MEMNKNSYYLLVGGTIATLVGSGIYTFKNFFLKSNQVTNKDIDYKPEDESSMRDLLILVLKRYENAAEEIDPPKERKGRLRLKDSNEDRYLTKLIGMIYKKEQAINEIKFKLCQEKKIDVNVFNRKTASMEISEEEFFKNYNPMIDTNELPDKSSVKEAYLFYGSKMMELYTSTFYLDPTINPSEKDHLEKIENGKIEDDLYIKYGLSITEIKYLLCQYNLFDHPEVKKYSKLRI